MKKIKLIAIGLVGLMSTGMAVAENVELTSGPNPITMLQCDQLANDISVVLSGGVVGGVDCDTDPDGTVIGLTVCHQTGLTTNRTESETPTDANNDGTKECPEGMALNDDQSACIGTVTGSKFPSATTAAGTVTSRYPGSTCTGANALAEAAVAVGEATQ